MAKATPDNYEAARIVVATLDPFEETRHCAPAVTDRRA
jgi:hypothetical protein